LARNFEGQKKHDNEYIDSVYGNYHLDGYGGTVVK
jgi:hypothetical protein